MNKRCNGRLRIPRIMGSAAVFVLGVLSALGSGGGGDSGGSASGLAPSPITNLNFDADNSLAAARSAARVMSFFPDFTALVRKITTTLDAAVPGNSPFNLALCANAGHAVLTWIDSDHSEDISMGDSTSLQLTDCDLNGNGGVTTGTVKFGFTSVDHDALPNSASLNVSLNLELTDSIDTETYTADFGAMTTTQDGVDFTHVYTANPSTSQRLSVMKNSAELTQFGCFKVTQSFSTADSPGTFKLSSSGVINASNKILSLADAGQMSFVNEWLEAGTQRLLSFSPSGCTVLGIADGGSGSDGSYIDMEALGGGQLRLHTINASNVEFNTLNSTWGALLSPPGL